MKLFKVKINNYKSFEDTNNELNIEDSITAIIGKNESGKTNVLNAVGDCSSGQGKFASKQNKRTQKPIEIDLYFCFENSPEEKSFVEFGTTVLHFSDNKTRDISGALKEAIDNDEKLNKNKDILFEELRKATKLGNESDTLIEILSNAVTNILESRFNETIVKLQNLVKNGNLSNTNVDIKSIINDYSERIKFYYALLPTIFFYTPSQLKTKYTMEDIKNDNSIIKLFNIGEVTKNELIIALDKNADLTAKTKSQNKAEKALKKVSDEFSKFYQKEKVNIITNIRDSYFEILVDNSEDSLPIALTERSNGLKWYLDLFIQLKSQDLLDKKLLILIDEPGVYLHIDAQKKLLEFFSELAIKNQIIYTTHSPFMLDMDNLNCIRIVENIDGKTIIHNKFHSANLQETSRMEILSPLIKALGFSTRYNLGPSYNKLNLIVEGVSDYNYILGMLKYLAYDEETIPNIIPSVGVDNIHNIASILLGWGVKFKIVTDFDKEAYNEYKNLKKLGLEELVDYFPLNLQKVDNIQMKMNPFLIENMFDETDKKQFDIGDKALSSKKFLDMVQSSEITLSESTIKNFKRLFEKILSKI